MKHLKIRLHVVLSPSTKRALRNTATYHCTLSNPGPLAEHTCRAEKKPQSDIDVCKWVQTILFHQSTSFKYLKRLQRGSTSTRILKIEHRNILKVPMFISQQKNYRQKEFLFNAVWKRNVKFFWCFLKEKSLKMIATGWEVLTIVSSSIA